MADRAARAELLGLAFDPVTLGAAAERCLAWCEGPRRSHVVITANAAILCMMRRDPALRDACLRGDLAVADGMAVVWALRASGQRVPERVTGVDLMPRLLEEGARRGLSAYFLGAREEVVRTLVADAARRYPGLTVAGWRNGYFGPAEHEAIVEDIRARRPHLLFVGMPTPFKEVFCERHRDRLEVPVILGVGGSFDVLAGYVRRAPRLLRAAGMEWFWRLLMEPRKLWRRYLTTNVQFLWLAGREALARRLGAGARGERKAGAP